MRARQPDGGMRRRVSLPEREFSSERLVCEIDASPGPEPRPTPRPIVVHPHAASRATSFHPRDIRLGREMLILIGGLADCRRFAINAAPVVRRRRVEGLVATEARADVVVAPLRRAEPGAVPEMADLAVDDDRMAVTTAVITRQRHVVDVQRICLGGRGDQESSRGRGDEDRTLHEMSRRVGRGTSCDAAAGDIKARASGSDDAHDHQLFPQIVVVQNDAVPVVEQGRQIRLVTRGSYLRKTAWERSSSGFNRRFGHDV